MVLAPYYLYCKEGNMSKKLFIYHSVLSNNAIHILIYWEISMVAMDICESSKCPYKVIVALWITQENENNHEVKYTSLVNTYLFFGAGVRKFYQEFFTMATTSKQCWLLWKNII